MQRPTKHRKEVSEDHGGAVMGFRLSEPRGSAPLQATLLTLSDRNNLKQTLGLPDVDTSAKLPQAQGGLIGG